MISVERFLAFSDAYFAIIATLMATHLVHLNDDTVERIRHSDSFTLADGIRNNISGFVIYFSTFFFIAKIFDEHATEMNVKRIRPNTVTAHIVLFFPAVAVLPLTTSMMSLYFKDDQRGPIPFFINLIVLDIARAWIHETLVFGSNCGIIVLGKFYIVVGHPSLTSHFAVDSVALKGSIASKYIWLTTATEVTAGILCIIVSIFSRGNYETGGNHKAGELWTIPIYIVLILLSGNLGTYIAYRVSPEIQRAVECLEGSISSQNQELLGQDQARDEDEAGNSPLAVVANVYRRRTEVSSEDYALAIDSNLSRPYLLQASVFEIDRLEAFADGVIGVVATLIILEIKPEQNSGGEPTHSLRTYLSGNVREIISAFAVLLLAVSLWNVHATLLQMIQMVSTKVSRTTFILNLVMLSILGIFPFSFSLVADFPKEHMSALVLGIVLFAISLCFLLDLIYVTYKFRDYATSSTTSKEEEAPPINENEAENERQREIVRFEHRGNRVKANVLVLTSASVVLIGIGLAHGSGKIHEWVVSAIICFMVLGLATELISEGISKCSSLIFGDDDEAIESTLREKQSTERS